MSHERTTGDAVKHPTRESRVKQESHNKLLHQQKESLTDFKAGGGKQIDNSTGKGARIRKMTSVANCSRKLPVNATTTTTTARCENEKIIESVPDLTLETDQLPNVHHQYASAHGTKAARSRASSHDSLNSSEWLSPSLLHLTNRVMTRLAELSSSSSPTAIGAGSIPSKRRTNEPSHAGLKTTGLLYNRSGDEADGHVYQQNKGYKAMHDLEVGAGESSLGKGHKKRPTQDEMLMTQQLSGFQAETDEVLRSIASSLLTDSGSPKANTPYVPAEAATTSSLSSMAKGVCATRDVSDGYDTDDDGLQKELAQLHSVAEQLRHDLDGASSFLPAVLANDEDSDGAVFDNEDVAQMSKHLKSWGFFSQDRSDTMIVSAENSVLVIFSFVLAVVWFLNRDPSSIDDGRGHNWIL